MRPLQGNFGLLNTEVSREKEISAAITPLNYPSGLKSVLVIVITRSLVDQSL